MFENNVLESQETVNENLKEINIIPEKGVNEFVNDESYADQLKPNNEVTVEISNDNNEFIMSESTEKQCLEPNVTIQNYTTRSGRVVKPPKMYGFE